MRIMTRDLPESVGMGAAVLHHHFYRDLTRVAIGLIEAGMDQDFICNLTDAVTTLQATPLDGDLERKFQEWAEIQRSMEDLQKQLTELSGREAVLQKELLPIVKEAAEQKVVVDEAIVRYKTRRVTSTSYANLFAKALELVSDEARTVLVAMKEQLTSSYMKEFLKLEPSEGIKDVAASVWSKLKAMFSKLAAKVKRFSKATSQLEKLSNILDKEPDFLKLG